MSNKAVPKDPSVDVTGRDRLVKNTIISWASELFIILIGFIMPRLIDETLGQDMLGVWDLAWTFANFLRMASLGVSSSVNRFVAKYRAEERFDKLNIFVSTVVSIQTTIATLLALSLIPIYLAVGYYYAEELGPNLAICQYTIVTLGLCVAIEILFDSMRGVITGHHRWDIHNLLYAIAALWGLILMATTVLVGGNVLHLAMAYLVSVISVELLRLYLGLKIAPYIKRDIRLFNLKEAKELVTFGLKTMLLWFAPAIIIQGVQLVTAGLMGFAALAIYSRQFALIRHLSKLIEKFTVILAPTASSLQTLDNKQELTDFFVATVRFNFAIALPAIAFFVAFGDVLVGLWMGSEYQHWLLMSALSVGHLLVYGQDACIRILQGLNKHGKLALYLIPCAFGSALITYLFLLGDEWTLVSSATLLVVPMTLCFGILSPAFTCLSIGINLFSYLNKTILKPLLLNIPFILILALSRLLFEESKYTPAAIAFVFSGVVELAIYYRYLLPNAVKIRIVERLARKPKPEAKDGVGSNSV